MKIVFGRKSGEKTIGVVRKINLKTAKVEILEDRGDRSKSGTTWGVHFSLMEKHDGESPSPVVTLSNFETLPTITFKNTEIGDWSTIICEDVTTLARERARLDSLSHIEIMCVTNAVFKSREVVV